MEHGHLIICGQRLSVGRELRSLKMCLSLAKVSMKFNYSLLKNPDDTKAGDSTLSSKLNKTIIGVN